MASASQSSKESRTGKGGHSAFLSGAVSGVFTSALLQPFDVIKTRLQAQAAAGGAPRGMLTIGTCIAQKEGVAALWSGVGPACLRVGGGAGLYFLCLSSAQKVMAEHWPRGSDGKQVMPNLKTFSLGAMSRATAAFVFCPITVVKTRMEYAAMSGVHYRNTGHALLTIARQERLRGLFSGVVPTLIRDAPYSGLYLLMFSNLRDVMDVNQDSPLGTFVAAMLAGGVATVVTHPPDVVRTRLQLRRNMMAAAGAVARTVPLPAVRLGDIIRQEGVLALWSGIAPRVVRRTLQQAITWTLFEHLFQKRIDK